MFDRDNCIWVAPQAVGQELGTRDKPFGDIGRALAQARPGQTVVLACGTYEGDRTIQSSGTMESPIRIVAEEPGKVVVSGACWFFYDVSDIVMSGIVFRGAPAGAISFVGACCRNALRELVFEDCSRGTRPAATLYLGGSGSRCNVVERCVFRHSTPERDDCLSVERASVALMVAQGDREGGMANVDLVIRGNTFTNYGYGVMVGTQDDAMGQYGHRIEHNTFIGCRGDAITVKCGDTVVVGNMVVGGGRSGITLIAGMSSMVIGNRIRDCVTGIRLCGSDHTVAHNCIIGCSREGVHVSVALGPGTTNARGVLVERNTVVDCGDQSSGEACGVRADEGTSCIVRGNLFAVPGIPYRVPAAVGERSAEIPSLFIDNVAVSGSCDVEGCRVQEIAFADRCANDFRTDSGYGAEGWAASPDIPRDDDDEEDAGYREAMAQGAQDATELSSEVHELVDEDSNDEWWEQGLFFPDLPSDGR